jgi:hypothetical protein
MTAPTDSPQERFAAWLRDRAIRHRVEETFPLDETPEDAPHPAPLKADLLCDPDPQPGDIRLLAPQPAIPLTRTPIHLLILEKHHDGSFLTVPFSPFDQPATEGEFLLFAPDDVVSANPGFRTLSLWNSLPLPAEILGQSWLFGKLPAADLQAVKTVAHWLRSATLGQPLDASQLPDALRARIGPPLAKLRGPALYEVMEYLNEEESWTLDLAYPDLAAELAADSLEDEDPATEPASLAIPWRDLLKSAARVPEGLGPPENLARRFAVWVCDSPVSQILQSAGKATLLFYEEATRIWEKVLPKSESGQLLWETEKTVTWSGDGPSMEPSHTFLGAIRGGIMGAPPGLSLVHTPDLPSGCPVLLLDGRTSQLLGRGETSKGGIQIHLLTEIPPDAPLQLVLCKKEPPPEDFI